MLMLTLITHGEQKSEVQSTAQVISNPTVLIWGLNHQHRQWEGVQKVLGWVDEQLEYQLRGNYAESCINLLMYTNKTFIHVFMQV